MQAAYAIGPQQTIQVDVLPREATMKDHITTAGFTILATIVAAMFIKKLIK